MLSGVTSAGFSQEKVSSQDAGISPVTKIALEVMALLQKTSSPLAEIKKKILLDPALTLVVIRGAYGENREGNAHLTLTEAMEKLGFSALKALLSEFFTRSLYARNRSLQMLLWKHSLTVALATEKIAGAIGLEREESYLCGLLHDLGKCLLYRRDPERSMEIHSQGLEGLLERENGIWGVTHPQVGHLWMSDSLGETLLGDVLLYHHNPELYGGESPLPRLVAWVDRRSYSKDLLSPPGTSEESESLLTPLGEEVEEILKDVERERNGLVASFQ